jgi:hypothetical protein
VRRLLTLGVVMGALAMATAGCGESLTSQEFEPSQTVTETFTGTLTPGGGQTHLFTTLGKGVIAATITAIGDDNTRILGLSLGNWQNNACQISAANDSAIANFTMAASVTSAGNLCARVYDSRGIPDNTDYTLQVVHP